MLSVGLTGGVASGKSVAAAEFRALGAPVFEADQVAREVVMPGAPALAQIAAEFGTRFLQQDGALDRAKMRRHVFADPAARRRLEAITHPAIRVRLLQWRDAQTAPYCVLDLPILFESGMEALVDRVLVVDVPRELQIRRLVARDGIGETLADQMLAAQLSRERRLERADDVLDNSGTLEELRAGVARLHAFYLDLAKSGKKPAKGLHLP